MPITEQEILDAYALMRPEHSGISQRLFDALFPAPVEGNIPLPFMAPGTLGGGATSARPRLGWLKGLLNRARGIPKTQGSPGAAVPVSTARPAAQTSSEMLRQAQDQATRTFMRVRNPLGIARGGEQMTKLKDLMRYSRPDREFEALEAFPGLNAGIPKTASFEELQRKLAILRDLSREYGIDFGTLSRMGPK